MANTYLNTKIMMEYAELAVAGDDAIALYSLKRMRKCPWGYSFETHYSLAEQQAKRFSKNLVWC